MAPVLHAIGEIAREHTLTIGNLLHAGDGNLHPLMIFDRRERRDVAAVRAAGEAILTLALANGGTISGEHGIGSEKRGALERAFGPAELAACAIVVARAPRSSKCVPHTPGER